MTTSAFSFCSSRRFLRLFSFSALILLLCSTQVQSSSSKSLQHIQVKLLGKTYDISSVSNVGEVQLKLQQESGLTPQQQGRALFGGKQLSPLDDLTCENVKEGDILTFVPKKGGKRGGRHTHPQQQQQQQQQHTNYNTNNNNHMVQEPTTTTISFNAQHPHHHNNHNNHDSTTTLPSKQDQKEELLQEIRKSSVLLMMIKNGSLSLEDAALRYAEVMPKIVHHPLFTEIMLDAERLERNRKLILESPMYSNMIAKHPRLELTLNDASLYRESIRNGIHMLQSVTNEQLVRMFMEYIKQMLQY